jgi:hypothetical protein
VEAEFRQLVFRGLPTVRAEFGNGGADSLNSLTQSISGPSLLEIEKLIFQLQAVRDHLMNEGRRVQRAITEHVQMTEGASEFTKAIAENLAQWGRIAESSRADGASAAVPRNPDERSEPSVVDGKSAA